MIYLDSSVVLAQLLVEHRTLPVAAWQQPLISSRLLEYEVWTRINARHLAKSHGAETKVILGGIDFIELTPVVLARAREPFAVPVRTLDALHLASIEFLRRRRSEILLASFDACLVSAARALGIAIYDC